jgi:predicted DNA-binding transcriptional regulator AlpA
MRSNLERRLVKPATKAAADETIEPRANAPKARPSPLAVLPAPIIAPALFTTDQAAAYLGMSEAKFHELRDEPWMCAPIALGPRLVRWARADLDSAIAAMPRRSTKPDEPVWLANARNDRSKASGAPA